MTTRGTWDDPAIINDPRIDNENPVVRAVAQKLHSNESMHLHQFISSVICPYCALRASRVLRWAAEYEAGKEMAHDTPFGLIQRPSHAEVYGGEDAEGVDPLRQAAGAQSGPLPFGPGQASPL